MKFKLFFSTLLLGSVMNVSAQDNVSKVVTEIKNNEYFANGQVALLAVDMKTGEEIASYNSDMSVIPASNTKLFSTAAALELYGPDFKYKTQLVYTGKLDSAGVLTGNVIIKGGGDPLVEVEYLDFSDKKDVDFCVNPNGPDRSSLRRDVRIVAGARNASGVEIISDSQEYDDEGNNIGNRCE